MNCAIDAASTRDEVVSAVLALGRCYLATGNVDRAVSLFRRVIEIHHIRAIGEIADPEAQGLAEAVILAERHHLDTGGDDDVVGRRASEAACSERGHGETARGTSSLTRRGARGNPLRWWPPARSSAPRPSCRSS